MITLQIQDDDGAIRRALNALVQASANLSQPLKVIGENLKESTHQRFHDSKGPDGEPWAENAESTIQAYIEKFHGAHTHRGGLSDYGEKVKASKKPLLGETRRLSTEIYSALIDDMAVAVNSPAEYSAMQQFGGSKSEYPNLWGDIPARPFLGASADDREMILDVLANYLKKAMG